MNCARYAVYQACLHLQTVQMAQVHFRDVILHFNSLPVLRSGRWALPLAHFFLDCRFMIGGCYQLRNVRRQNQ